MGSDTSTTRRTIPAPPDFNPRSRMGSDVCRRRGGPDANSDFNPRSRMGSDSTREVIVSEPNIFQSTLPHGERPRRLHGCGFKVSRFQSTLPHGERRDNLRAPTPTRYFNPRSRMGSDRHWSRSPNSSAWHFNPRSRMGSDGQHHKRCVRWRISIHAPAWGATGQIPTIRYLPGNISIHAPAWGATLDVGLGIVLRFISIHAPAWGATPANR